MLVPLSRTILTPFVWLISPLLPGSSFTVTFLGKPFPQTQSASFLSHLGIRLLISGMYQNGNSLFV